MPNWNNVAPRFGAVYDLFGDARTALKGSVNKYMLPWAGGWAKRYDPFTSVSDRRNWSDLNRDDIAQDNEIGPSSNAQFGVSQSRFPGGESAPRVQRRDRVGVQHQLLPRLSVFAGYYHRRFYNQEAQQNPLLTHGRLDAVPGGEPAGDGEMITIFNLNPAKAGSRSKQLVDINSDINRTIYDGFEVSFNARLPQRRGLFGGWKQRSRSDRRVRTSTIRTSCASAIRRETFQYGGPAGRRSGTTSSCRPTIRCPGTSKSAARS